MSQIPTAANAIASLEQVSYRCEDHYILREVDMHFPRGQLVAILGPSGTGKTTLLRLLSGQIVPDHGTARIFGQDIARIKRRDIYILRQRVGFLFQNGALFTDLSVYDNVAFPLREHTKLDEQLIQAIVKMKLEAVGLRGASRLMPSELSGGMARRVALARAIVLDPSLVMYDEPLTGLDPISKGVVLKLMRELNDALGLTSILVSHDVSEVLSVADYVYIISNSQIIGQGTPGEIRESTAPMVQQFIRGLPDGPVSFHYPAVDYREDLMGGA